MLPHSGRSHHYAVDNRQSEFAAVVQRVLPRTFASIETTALCLLLSALWGLVLYTALSSGL
jgi:hypothetical protein